MRRMFDNYQRTIFTPAQIRAARFFLIHHNNLRMSPTLRRVLHDAVVMDLPREAMELKYRWPNRSAKQIIGLFLNMVTEIMAVQAPRAQPPSPGQALIDYLCVPVADPVVEQLVSTLGLTVIEARLIEIIRRSQGALITHDALIARLYVYDFEAPEDNIVQVHIHKIRNKIRGGGVRIDNLSVGGYGLRVAESTSLPPLLLRPELGETTQDEDEMLDYLGVSAVQTALLRLVQRFGLTPTEARMLQYLRAAPGGFLTYSVLYDRLYAMADTAPKPDITKVTLCHLRRKLKCSEYSITTIWGEGLRLTTTTKENANV